jgi:flagellar protein FliO/FliZ
VNTSLLPSLLAFVAVLAMIPAALWLLRRAQSPRATRGPLAVVGGVALGPRERIVVLRAADRHLLVGVTAQSMTLLAELERWPSEPGAQAGAFASLLERTRDETRRPG